MKIRNFAKKILLAKNYAREILFCQWRSQHFSCESLIKCASFLRNEKPIHNPLTFSRFDSSIDRLVQLLDARLDDKFDKIRSQILSMNSSLASQIQVRYHSKGIERVLILKIYYGKVNGIEEFSEHSN